MHRLFWLALLLTAFKTPIIGLQFGPALDRYSTALRSMVRFTYVREELFHLSVKGPAYKRVMCMCHVVCTSEF